MSEGKFATRHSAAAACCMVPASDDLSLKRQDLLHACSAAA